MADHGRAARVCGGALVSAALNLADRLDSRHLFAGSALLGALTTAAIACVDVGVTGILALRVLTGATLAGVYPPGMKLMATWCQDDRGLGIESLILLLYGREGSSS